MSRRLRASALIASLALVIPVSSAAQVPVATSDVVVIDAGAEPRRELRYDWTVDQQERLRSSLVIDMVATEADAQVMDMELPVSMTIHARVTEVNPNHTAWVAMTFEDMAFGPLVASGGGLADDDAVGPVFDDAMAQIAPLLSEVRVWQLLSDRGRVVRTNVQFPDGFPVEAEQQIRQTSSSVPLLPREPVGVGARWEATGTTDNQGVSISVTTTMELIEMDGHVIALAMSVRLDDSADTSLPTVNPFDQLAVDGGGSYHLDLGRVFPSGADVTMAMTMAGDIPDGTGTSNPVAVEIDIDMVMTSREVG